MKKLFISVFIILSTKKPKDFITTNSFHKSMKKRKKIVYGIYGIKNGYKVYFNER